MSMSYNSRINVKVNVPSNKYKVDLHNGRARVDLVETSDEDSDIGYQSVNIKFNANHKNHKNNHPRHNQKKRKRASSNDKHGDKSPQNKKRKTGIHDYDHQNTSYPINNKNKDDAKYQMQRTARKVCDAFGLELHFRRNTFVKNITKC